MEQSPTGTTQPNLIERGIFAVLLAGLFVGFATSFLAPEYYDGSLAAEDGPLEWITALALLVCSLTCLYRAITRRDKGAKFVFVTTAAAIILFFGAGEEISWGQRVFGWASNEFFLENNAQDETNLHNLMVGDTKINKLIFGAALTLVFLLYFTLLPYLASRLPGFGAFVNSWFVPLARPIHAYLFVAALVLTAVMTADRAPELAEFALGLLLSAVILWPANKDAIL